MFPSSSLAGRGDWRYWAQRSREVHHAKGVEQDHRSVQRADSYQGASVAEAAGGWHSAFTCGTGRSARIFILNGAILGMSRAEIKAKFDEIVAFAEVERFLDTPVKRFSSGMYVRLAFAVAAHLEPKKF